MTRRFLALYHHQSVTSTNDEAWRLLDVLGAKADGAVVVAASQTGGRGRLGRTWSSPQGNLYCSLLRRIVEPMERTSIVSLLAGIALVEAVDEVTGIGADLKWPNDLLVTGLKLAGILLEGRDGFQVVGVGVNVNVPVPQLAPEVRGTATSLVELRQETTMLEPLLMAFLARFAQLEEAFVAAPLLPVDRYLRYFPYVGTRVKVTVGPREIVAPIAGIASDGALLLHDAAGAVVRITTGEVTHVRPV
jgi:BirA family biotin operon repressor/biotin-[acetyl-CoA-carboxylase] ligase